MSNSQVPAFCIDLDLSPEERYLEVFVNYQDNIRIIHEEFYKSIPESRRKFFKTLAKVIESLDNDYYKEIECMSNITGSDIEKCLAVDYICEASTGCTSIISKMVDSNGNFKMVHGRNLDFPVAVETMKDSLFKAIFVKNGKEICTGTLNFYLKDILLIYIIRPFLRLLFVLILYYSFGLCWLSGTLYRS